MHSTQGPSGQWYAHNGDYSGSVHVHIPVRDQTRYPDKDRTTASAVHNLPGEEGEFVQVQIPFEDIRALYLAHLRSAMISQLEQQDATQLEEELIGTHRIAAHPALRGLRDDQLERLAEFARGLSSPKLREKGVYKHKTGVALARIDRLTSGGHVRFSIWYLEKDTTEWISGSMLSPREFQDAYPDAYTGPVPVTQIPDAPEGTE
jgi:hypothetical protein